MEVGWGDFENLFVIDDDMETPGLVFDVSGRASLLGGDVDGVVETEEQEETSSCSPRSRAIIFWPAMA